MGPLIPTCIHRLTRAAPAGHSAPALDKSLVSSCQCGARAPHGGLALVPLGGGRIRNCHAPYSTAAPVAPVERSPRGRSRQRWSLGSGTAPSGRLSAADSYSGADITPALKGMVMLSSHTRIIIYRFFLFEILIFMIYHSYYCCSFCTRGCALSQTCACARLCPVYWLLATCTAMPHGNRSALSEAERQRPW